jgi:hypothetical protein
VDVEVDVAAAGNTDHIRIQFVFSINAKNNGHILIIIKTRFKCVRRTKSKCNPKNCECLVKLQN